MLIAQFMIKQRQLQIQHFFPQINNIKAYDISTLNKTIPHAKSKNLSFTSMTVASSTKMDNGNIHI